MSAYYAATRQLLATFDDSYIGYLEQRATERFFHEAGVSTQRLERLARLMRILQEIGDAHIAYAQTYGMLDDNPYQHDFGYSFADLIAGQRVLEDDEVPF